MTDSLPRLNQLPTILQAAQLDGTKGTNRELTAKLQIDAKNDYDALQCWLNEYSSRSTTYRTYQKEAERFLLWCIYKRQKALSSLNREDFDAFISFLDDPQPREKWCAMPGGRGRKRGSSTWRPFAGPLSLSAKTTAMSVIDSLFNYLVDARYLSFNPLSLMRKRQFKSHVFQEKALTLHERLLDQEEWQALLQTLESWPNNTVEEKLEKERLQFLIAILFFLGLRIQELASHTWQAFRKIEGQWWFFVIGKGSKQAKIPVNDELLRAIIRYRAFLKKAPLPESQDRSPLIPSLRNNQAAISSRQINKLLKKLALATAAKFKHKPESINKFKKFSAHWLRHLSASMQDRAGIAFKHIRANLRHENDDTTRLYVHAFDADRHEDSQKLKMKKKEVMTDR